MHEVAYCERFVAYLFVRIVFRLFIGDRGECRLAGVDCGEHKPFGRRLAHRKNRRSDLRYPNNTRRLLMSVQILKVSTVYYCEVLFWTRQSLLQTCPYDIVIISCTMTVYDFDTLNVYLRPILLLLRLNNTAIVQRQKCKCLFWNLARRSLCYYIIS